MSEADRYLADSAAFVRSLDPCGFLTEVDLAALGTVVQLRPEGELSTCSASLKPGQSSATDSVSIDLNGYQPTPDDPRFEQITIDGEQVHLEDSSRGSCRISFPLRAEFDGAGTGTMDGFLTESGRETIRAIEKSVKKTEKQALKGLDKKDQKTLFKLLARIEANLSNEEMVLIDDEVETEE